MHVATDGNYNLKILNDAFEGRAQENEEIDLINIDGEFKIKKKTKRPPVIQKPEVKTSAATEEKKDARLAAIMEEVMRKSAADFKLIDEQFEKEAAEEEAAANAMALVPVNQEQEKKKRNQLLKLKAKAMIGANAGQNSGKVIFDIDAEGGTFVTGVGIPGSKKVKNQKYAEEEEMKYYTYPEDELWERVNKTEKEMQDMLNYLN